MAGKNLSPRERECLEHRARGFSYKQIAAQLSISTNTVKHHLSQVFKKLSVRSSLEAVRLL